MGTFRLKRKLFTTSRYDETDEIKRMKDSDILAAEKKKKPGFGKVISRSAQGAVKGLAVGAGLSLGAAGASGVLGGIKGFKATPKGSSKFVNALGGVGSGVRKSGGYIKKGLKLGVTLGAATSGYKALKERNDEARDVDFYNHRLEDAKRHAERRERMDWKQNTTQRDGYSF